MKYYLLFDPHSTFLTYCLVKESDRTRTNWTSSLSSILSDPKFTASAWPTTIGEHLEQSFKNRRFQILATFNSKPNLSYLTSHYPELLL